MKTSFENYIQSISSKFKYEETSEMGYRTDFEILVKRVFEEINVKRIDHDAKAKEGNKPDFAILKFDIPILYIEAKDIGVSLDKIEKSEQMNRYYGYANLVLTNYVEFRFYRNGERYDEPIIIAEHDLKNRTLTPKPENYERTAKTLLDFAQSHKEPIRSGKHLAKIMGGKAQRIRDNLLHFLAADSEKNNEINKIYNTLKKLLVHDLRTDSFADMYAQTLVYGLFVARYHDKTPESFSRMEARELVPTSNPFLRHFFDHIVGPDFDKRLEYIVDELCEVFSHANVTELMKQYFRDDLWGKSHEGPDPVIHFYEDFLREYDPVLRKKLGAYYTPQPVVRFIVRAVDQLLAKEFGLANGLADTAKLENGTHRVQILDPAVGTGTFLSAIIRSIYLSLKEANQIGRWTSYVHHDLLPRLHGFEIMMAPYTIAHLKLSMAFKATGFKHFNRRLGIYLTNSLEEADDFTLPFTGFGFAESIAEESKEASQIKNDTPIMVVIGNPPYSVSSSNKSEWITDLTKSYKKDLNERNIQPLSDDYIKFIRYAEHFVEKNKTGIVAMITNNSFLDGIIHRQMRKHLLETFDEIYVLDLHGNAKKKETAPDGSKDENVFNIMQGVAITIMIKKSIYVGEGRDRPPHATVKFSELFGKRNDKFQKLNERDINSISWQTLKGTEPNYFFVQKDFAEKKKYEEGFIISELMKFMNPGVESGRDNFFIAFNRKDLELRMHDVFMNKNSIDNLNKYKITDSTSFRFKSNFDDALYNSNNIQKISYRPFDFRFSYYDIKLQRRPSFETFDHILKGSLGLVIKRGFDEEHSSPVFIINSISDRRGWSRAGMQGAESITPLYLYSDDGTKVPNLNEKIVNEIEETTGKTEPEEILDYIYAVLHSPGYRKKYKEFLKIDFPRVPYPKDKTTFNQLVKLGTELRQIHLLESPKVNKFITTYPVMGDDSVEKPIFKTISRRDNSRVVPTVITGNVWINKKQYFGNVPELAWNFYIGGYQPAQKWLKDRKGRTLTNEEIEHYQKIIIALTETDRLMKEIEKVEF